MGMTSEKGGIEASTWPIVGDRKVYLGSNHAHKYQAWSTNLRPVWARHQRSDLLKSMAAADAQPLCKSGSRSQGFSNAQLS